ERHAAWILRTWTHRFSIDVLGFDHLDSEIRPGNPGHDPPQLRGRDPEHVADGGIGTERSRPWRLRGWHGEPEQVAVELDRLIQIVNARTVVAGDGADLTGRSGTGGRLSALSQASSCESDRSNEHGRDNHRCLLHVSHPTLERR